MKHLIKGFIYYNVPKYGNKKPVVTFLPFKASTEYNTWGVEVGEHSFEVEVPDDFDPRPQQVAALRAQKEKDRAEFAAKVVEYDRQINELLAIENGSAS